MLDKLTIRNYAIIDEIDFLFHSGLNILTGETGAGKSIIVGALNLLLGARADTRVLYDESKKCWVEAQFSIKDYQIFNTLDSYEEFDIQENEAFIIRREINAKGKSRAFINDTPVPISLLKKISPHIISLHQQFDTLDLNNPEIQRKYLDVWTGNLELLKEYQQKYSEYSELMKKLQQLKNQEKKSDKEIEFLTFQLNELNNANLENLNLKELEESYRSLNNAEEIKHSLNHLSNTISHVENNLVDQMIEMANALSSTSKIHRPSFKIKSKIESLYEELKDIGQEAESINEGLEVDPASIKELKDRLDLIYQLQNKHKKNSPTDLIEIKEAIQTQIEYNHKIEEYIHQAEEQVNKAESIVNKIAVQLKDSRVKAAIPFEEEITELLHKLTMTNAKFHIDIKDTEQFDQNGKDEIRFLFSANKGVPLNPIEDIASGGELSRLALSIKSLIARKSNLPTMVFDEIDAGVSGKVALFMGELMKNLSNDSQMIVITHSPQIAVYGGVHYLIFKEDSEHRTHTKVKQIQGQERITKIAELLSSDPPSATAIENAKELFESVRT